MSASDGARSGGEGGVGGGGRVGGKGLEGGDGEGGGHVGGGRLVSMSKRYVVTSTTPHSNNCEL